MAPVAPVGRLQGVADGAGQQPAFAHPGANGQPLEEDVQSLMVSEFFNVNNIKVLAKASTNLFDHDFNSRYFVFYRVSVLIELPQFRLFSRQEIMLRWLQIDFSEVLIKINRIPTKYRLQTEYTLST